MRPSVRWLLVFVPVSIALALARIQAFAFITSAVAIIPLAALLGEGTEQLALHVGPRLGGLLNATFGNLTELIVAGFLVAANQFDVAKASLTGSIIGNLLLVLGVAMLAGGWKRSEQSFSARSAGVHTASLVLAMAALLMPAILGVTSPRVSSGQTEALSIVVAAVLMLSYVGSVVFTQVTHSHLFHTPEPGETARWTRRRSLAILAVAAVGVGVESEILVASLQPALDTLHLPVLFVGLVLVPFIGNAAEHSSAVMFAIKDKMNIALEISIGSSSQVALFVAPALVFISLALGHPMDFVFTGFEIATVILATLIASVTSADGRSNWLEGIQLLGVYAIIAAATFFIR